MWEVYVEEKNICEKKEPATTTHVMDINKALLEVRCCLYLISNYILQTRFLVFKLMLTLVQNFSDSALKCYLPVTRY